MSHSNVYGGYNGSSQRRNLQLNSPPNHSPTHAFPTNSRLQSGRVVTSGNTSIPSGSYAPPMNAINQQNTFVGQGGKPVGVKPNTTVSGPGPMNSGNDIHRGSKPVYQTGISSGGIPSYNIGSDNFAQRYQWEGDEPVDMEPSFDDGNPYIFSNPNDSDIRPDIPRPDIPRPQERTFRPQDANPQFFSNSGFVGSTNRPNGFYPHSGVGDSSIVHPSISQHLPHTREPPSSPLNLKNYDDFLEQLQQKIKEMGFKDGNTKFLIELGKMRGQLEKLQQQITSKDEEIQILELDRNNAYRFIEELRSTEEKNRESLLVMEDELSKLGNEKGSLDQGLEKLKKERESLVQYAKEASEEKAKLIATVSEYKTQNITLSNQYNSLQSEHNKLNNQFEILSESNKKLQQQIEELNSVRSALNQKLEETEEKLEEKLRDYEELSSVQEELLEVIQQSKKEAETLQTKTFAATGEMDQLRQNSDRKELLITTLQKELEHVREQSKQQREELQAALEKMDHDHSVQMDSLNRQKSNLEEELHDWKLKFQNAENEISNLNRYISELRQTADLAGTLGGEVEKMESEKSSLLKKIAEQSKSISDLESQVSNLNKERNNLLSRIEKQNKEIDEHNKKVETINENLTTVETKLQITQKELEDQKTERTVERKVLHEEIHDLRSERDKLHSLEEEARKSKIILEEKYQEIETTLNSERRLFSEQKSSLDKSIKELTQENEYLSSQNAKFSNELNSYRSQVENNTLHIAEVSDIRSQLESQVREQQIRIEQLSADLIAAVDKKEKSEQESEYHKIQYEEIRERSQQEKTQNQLEVKSLCAMIKALKNNIAEKQKRVDELQASVQNDRAVANKDRDLRERALGDKEKLEEEINSCHEVIKTLRQTAEKLEEQHYQDQQKIRQATSQLEKTQNDRELEKRVLGAEIGHLRSVNKNLEKKLVEFMKNNLHNMSNSSIGSTTPMSTTPVRQNVNF